MPVKKLTFRSGVNRENTRYTNEGGWFECNNVRFRQGTPEKIGGWTRINSSTFDGIARSLHNWITLSGQNLIGVGTNLKFLIENGGAYNDITPVRSTTSSGDVTFSASNTTLSANVTSTSATTIAITDGTGFPVAGKVLIDSEIVDYTGITDNTLTGCTRGASKLVDDVATSTTAATHSSGAAVTCFTIIVTDAAHGVIAGDFVTFSGAASLGGNITATVLNRNYQIEAVETPDTYTILAKSFSDSTLKFTNVASTSSDSSNGGNSVVATYQVSTTAASATEVRGWGAGAWGSGPFGTGETSTEDFRLWTQSNFTEDLIFGPRGGRLYYWDASVSAPLETRAVELSTLAGASNVPTVQNGILVSDVSNFVFCFGANIYGSTTQNPMLIRWSDIESAVNWEVTATSQAGFLTLSKGTEIVGAKQSRQEILVWTDAALYSLQYVGIDSGVWSSQLLGEKISIASQNAMVTAGSATYWMGKDKFYKYDGRVQTLTCDLRKHVFTDFNTEQYTQVFGGSNEGYNEIWWFYCSGSATNIDKYIVYNYVENIWYYGSMARSAWLDSGLRNFPLAATYNGVLVNHEEGIDDNETATTAAISSFITSSEFDLDDGHQFMLMSRVIPDVSFEGSTSDSPAVAMTFFGLGSSGSGYNDPASESGVNTGTITRSATSPVEVYTTQVHTRVRGRQMSLKIESTTTGVQWQLGAPRLDMRPDGRR